MIGHKTAPLRKGVRGSSEWARLEPAGECNVADFIDSLQGHQGKSEPHWARSGGPGSHSLGSVYVKVVVVW